MQRRANPVVDLRTRLALAGVPSVMGILEKLRPQPRWKHADPAVRAAAVYELGPDDGDALRPLAREDAEARVRRAAVTRLTTSPCSATSAGPIRTRTCAPKRCAVWPAWPPRPTTSSARSDAVRQLSRSAGPRKSCVAARENPDPHVRGVVVDLLDDPKSLGSISRHAPDSATRLRALARLTDAEEIAQRRAQVGAHRCRGRRRSSASSGTEALVGDRAARPQQGGGAPRAHEAAPARGGGAAGAADSGGADERRGSRSAPRACCTAPKRWSRWPIRTRRRRRWRDVRLAWAELQADVEIDAALVQQFDAASEAVREAIAERSRSARPKRSAPQRLRASRPTAWPSSREIEQLSGPDALDRIAELKVRWDGCRRCRRSTRRR